MIRIATPVTKPVITAFDTNRTTLPSLSRPRAAITRPARRVIVNTACGIWVSP
jgi:hypothetical protein